MPKFHLDYKYLDNTIHKRSYKLSEVQDKLVRVAFDVVKFRDSDELWQVQSADDGEYIVARYDEDEVDAKVAEASVAATSPWNVAVNASNLDIFYKGHPIVRLAASKLGLSVDDLAAAKSFLPKKLASDKQFSKALLNELDVATRKQIISLYPELS